MTVDRRSFLVAGAGLALAGCDQWASSREGETALDSASDLTYEVQSRLRGDKLAPEYAASEISKVFKANGSIDPKDPAYKKMAAANFADFALEVGGLVDKPARFTLADLKAMPARTQVTRHDCVEGWSCIGQWTGVPLRDVLARVAPKPTARYVVFHCFDRYETDYSTDAPSPDLSDDVADTPRFYGSIGMADALHPQTILAYAMNDHPLPVAHGAPLRLRVERLLGYKMTKYIRSIELVENFAGLGGGKGGYWEDQGYEWYGGI